MVENAIDRQAACVTAFFEGYQDQTILRAALQALEA
jgi:hypothetical protein